MHTNERLRDDVDELQRRKDWDLVFAQLLIELSRQQHMTNEQIIDLANGKSASQDRVLMGRVRAAVGLQLDIERMKAHVTRLLTY